MIIFCELPAISKAFAGGPQGVGGTSWADLLCFQLLNSILETTDTSNRFLILSSHFSCCYSAYIIFIVVDLYYNSE